MKYPVRFKEDHEFELWGSLIQARDLLFKIRKKELRPQGLVPTESHILHIINSLGDKATPTLISRELFLTCHSISERLSRIEKKGLIRRVWDLDNKSSVRVEITEKGMEVYDKTRNLEAIREVVSVLSQKERKWLVSGLKKLVNKSIEKL